MSKKLYFIITCILLITVSEAKAYDKEITHKRLTEKAVESSKLSDYFGGYLSKNLGQQFRLNQDTEIGGKTIRQWLEEGSIREDDGPDTTLCRASNHFHNPLKAWPQAQMTDGILGVLNVGISIKTNVFSD